MILINSITICPENITVKEGNWCYDAYTEIWPTNATCKCVTWHSSNPSIASVNENGHICGVSEGVAVIYATSQDGGGAVGFCNVTVEKRIMVNSVSVTTSTKTVNVGDTFILSAIVCPSEADDKRLRWTSSNNNIAEVGYVSGRVTTKSEGTTYIYANAIDGSGVSGCCMVTVKSVPVTSVTVNPSSKIMAVGSATTLTATVLPSNATNKAILWSSSDENIATVNPNSGYVLAKNPGTTNIRAFSQDGSGQYMNCTITVNDLPDIDDDSWEEMGFKYDGSQRDFIRLNQDLPPYSYEQWILNGRQKALYIVDQTGWAGVINAGHARLLIRSDEGLWYRTEFVKNPSYDEIIIECYQITEEEKTERTTGWGIKYVCLYGDYTRCLTEAKRIASDPNNNYNGEYNAVTNNCMHYINEILSYSDNINDDVDSYIQSNTCFIPETYYDNLTEILNL